MDHKAGSNTFGSVHPSVCVGLWDLRCALLQQYRTTLCTADLRCAPFFTRNYWRTWNVRDMKSSRIWAIGSSRAWKTSKQVFHAREHFMFYSMSVRSAQRSFVLIRWCTRRFCMFTISSVRDGAQYNVGSLAVCVHLQELSSLSHPLS